MFLFGCRFLVEIMALNIRLPLAIRFRFWGSSWLRKN